MATQWYYAQNGQQSGPLTSDQLRNLLASGAVSPTDLVWSEGLPAWAPANQVPGLISAPAYTPAPAPAYVPPPAAAYVAPLAPVYAQPSMQGGVSQEAVTLLRKTKPWVRFLSVLGFLGLGLLTLGCLMLLLFPMGPLGAMPVGPRIAAAFAYFLLGLMQFPPVFFLHRYAGRISKLAASGAPSDLEEALRAQKSFWKYVGIFTLVVMILYILILVGVLIFAGATLFNR